MSNKNNFVNGDHLSMLRTLAKYRTLDKREIEKQDNFFNNMSKEEFKNYMKNKQKECLKLMYEVSK